MNDVLELLIKIKTEGLDTLTKTEGGLRKINEQAQQGSKDFKQFEGILSALTRAGVSYREAIEHIAKGSSGAVSKIARDILQADKEFQKLSAQAEKHAAAQAKLAEKAARDAGRAVQEQQKADETAARSADRRAAVIENAIQREIRAYERRAHAAGRLTNADRVRADREFVVNSIGPLGTNSSDRLNAAFDRRLQAAIAQDEAAERAAQQRADRRAARDAERTARREAAAQAAAERAAMRQEARERSAAERTERRLLRVQETQSVRQGLNLQRLGVLGAASGVGLPPFLAYPAMGAGLAAPLLIGAGVAGAFESVRNQGLAARETVNVANRLGLEVGEARKIEAEARLAGVSISSLEVGARQLAVALEDSQGRGRLAASALKELGVSTVDVRGNVRELGPVLLDTIEKLSGVENSSERLNLATKALGRDARTIIPLIDKHRELNAELNRLGLNLDSDLINKLHESETKFTAVGIAWDNLVAKFAQKIEPIVVPIVQSVTSMVAGTSKTPTTASGFVTNVLANTLTNSVFIPGFLRRAQEIEDIRTGKTPAPDRNAEYRADWNGVIRVPVPPEMQAATPRSMRNFSRFLSGLDGSEESLRQRVGAKKDELDQAISDAHKLEGSDVMDSARDRAIVKVRQLTKEYAQLNAQLEALQVHERAIASRDSFIERLGDAGLSPAGQVSAEAHKLAKNLSPREAAPLFAAAATEIDRLTGDIQKKRAEETRVAEQDTLRRNLQTFQAMNESRDDQEQALTARMRESIFPFVAMGRANAEISQIEATGDRQRVEFASRRALRKLDAGAGPGMGEDYRVAEESYRLRLSLAKELYDLDVERADGIFDKEQRRVAMARAEAERKKLEFQAEEDHEQRLSELQRQRIERSRSLAEGLFGSLTNGGVNNFFKQQGLRLASGVFTNFAAPGIDRALQSISLGDQRDGSGKLTSIGRLLQGTILEQTPEIKATDDNTQAIENLTASVDALAEQIGGAGAGAGTASAAGSAGGLTRAIGRLERFGSDIGGLTGANSSSIWKNIGKAVPFAGAVAGGIRAIAGQSSAPGSIADIPLVPLGTSNLRSPIPAGVPQLGFGSGLGAVLSPAGGGIPGMMGVFRDPNASGWGKAGAGIGVAAMAGLGAMESINQFRQGGARGITGGISTALMTAGGLAGGFSNPVGATLMTVGIIGQFVKSMFGDPKKDRAEEIAKALEKNQFLAPPTINSMQTTSGFNLGFDKFGRPVETTRFAGFNVEQPHKVEGPDGNFVTIGGTVSPIVSPQSAARRAPYVSAPPMNVSLTVQALDSRSILDRADDIGRAVHKAINGGGAVGLRIQQAVFQA